MSLDVRTVEDVAILAPKGMLLGGKETDEVEEKVRELDGAGNEKLLINLGKTTFMSSMGMAFLFWARTKYVQRGARVKLCCIDNKIREVFVIVKLTLIYGDDIHDTEEEALASFRQLVPSAGR
jgi:anti-anti-sigma factor